MKKAAVIGICGQSVFLNCDRFPSKGESVLSNSIHIEPGGKGANAACAIKRLGGNVSFLVSVGDDEYGKVCLKFLKKEKINTTSIIKKGNTDYGIIMNDSSGDNSVIVSIDNNVKLNEDDLLKFESELKTTDYLLLSGELSDEILLNVIKLCNKKTRIIFDPSPIRNYPIDFLNSVWLFTPNEQEEDNIYKLIKPNNIVTTLGDKGARLIENGVVTYFDGEKVEVVNTTGAGDVFNGSLIYALLNDYSLKDAVKFAIHASAYKVSHNYVIEGIPSLNDLK